jgi:hypothetical protein
VTRLLRRARPNTIASLVVAVTFGALLISAGLRATPGVLMTRLNGSSDGIEQPYRCPPRSGFRYTV